MARIQISMRVVECTCGKLHELVWTNINGVGDHRYRCSTWGDVRAVVIGVKTREVTLGLSKDPE